MTAKSFSRPSVRATAMPQIGRMVRPLTLLIFAAALVVLSGCGPVRLVASARIPQPLVMKIPVAVALFMPAEFVQYVHKEERWGTDWNIEIGKAQADAITQLMGAMFESVVAVESLNAGSALGSGIAAILEPSVEEYAFVTPRDAGSPFFAVSIKYRVNLYSPDGKLADSWGFTGYGTAPAGGLSNTEPLQNATALAMRDAGAKLAVEFRDQAIVRGLLPPSETADDPAKQPAPGEPAVEGATAPTETPQAPENTQPASGEEPEQAPSQDSEMKEEDEPAPPDVEAFAATRSALILRSI